MAALRFAGLPRSPVIEADAWLTHLSAVAGADHVSWQRVATLLDNRIRADVPGWFPTSTLPLRLWLVDFAGILVVKWVQYLLVVANVVTFAAVIRRLDGSKSFVAAACGIALAIWQVRSTHDPVFATSLGAPVLVELILLALLAAATYRERGDTRALLACVVLCIAACWHSAAGWFFALASAAIAWRPHRRAGSLAVAAASVAAIALSLAIERPAAPWASHGPYLRDVLFQALSALPGTARMTAALPNAHGIPSLWFNGTRYVDDRFFSVPTPSALEWLIAMTLAVMVCSLAAGSASPVARTERTLLPLGAAMWLVPALLLGPPSLWRGGLQAGEAFPIVELQTFGVALLGATALRAAMRATSSGRALVLAPVVLAVLVFAYGNARWDHVVMRAPELSDRARSVIERAGAAGFFDRFPDGATVAVDPHLPFADGLHHDVADARYALYRYSHRRYHVVAARRGTAHAWLLQTPQGPGTMSLALEHIASSGPAGFLVDRSRGYTVFPAVWTSVEGRHRGLEGRVHMLTDGADADVRRLCGPVPPGDAFTAEAPRVRWGPGFFPFGPQGYTAPGPGDPESWSGDRASSTDRRLVGTAGSFEIVPSGCGASHFLLTAGFRAAGQGMMSLRSGSQHADWVVAPVPIDLVWGIEGHGMRPVRVDVRVDAPPGDLNRILFRYQRDVPRKPRLIFVVDDLQER